MGPVVRRFFQARGSNEYEYSDRTGHVVDVVAVVGVVCGEATSASALGESVVVAGRTSRRLPLVTTSTH
jgi:choline-glycine betaine transporter